MVGADRQVAGRGGEREEERAGGHTDRGGRARRERVGVVVETETETEGGSAGEEWESGQGTRRQGDEGCRTKRAILRRHLAVLARRAGLAVSTEECGCASGCTL